MYIYAGLPLVNPAGFQGEGRAQVADGCGGADDLVWRHSFEQSHQRPLFLLSFLATIADATPKYLVLFALLVFIRVSVGAVFT